MGKELPTSRIFIKYWKPKVAIFVDSEIWPNMYKNLHEQKIPLMLINARITRRSFNRWKYFPNFSKKIFEKINIALPQNIETKKFLKILGTKKIKLVGNLKFHGPTQSHYNNSIFRKKFLKKTINYKNEFYCDWFWIWWNCCSATLKG